MTNHRYDISLDPVVDDALVSLFKDSNTRQITALIRELIGTHPKIVARLHSTPTTINRGGYRGGKKSTTERPFTPAPKPK